MDDYLIVNAYSYNNAGDAAIVLSTVELFKRLGGRTRVSSRYGDRSAYRHHGVEPVQEIVPYPEKGSSAEALRLLVLLGSLLGALAVIGVARFSRSAARAVAHLLTPRAVRLVHRDTTVVIAGGGYMYSSRRRVNLGLIQCMVSIRLGNALAHRAVMMPQSIGPLNKRLDSTLVSWALRPLQVVARERFSLEASSIRPELDSVLFVPDTAFLGAEIQQEAIIPAQRSGPVARLVVMDWSWSSSVDPRSFGTYLARVAELGDRLVAEGWFVVLGGHSSLPEHGQDDVAIAREVAERMTCASSVDADTSYAHLVQEYRAADLVIGTRLHSCIMALAEGTPAIALAYQEKARGVLVEAGFGEFVQNVDSLDVEGLLVLVGRAMSEDVLAKAAAARDQLLNYYTDWFAKSR